MQGADAFKTGEWQKAYDLFRRAEALYHAPPHLLYMARSSEKLGRLVEAVELYNRIIHERLSSGAPEAFVHAQERSRVEVEPLKPRLARLTVTIQGQTDEPIEVRANGKTIAAGLLGVAHPVDPGTYELTVEAEHARAEPVVVTLAEGGQESVTLRLETPEEATPTTEPVGVATGGDASFADQGAGSSPMPAYIALGVGAVGVGLGTVFLLDRLSKQNEADELFQDGGCAEDGACTGQEQEEIKDLSSQAATSGTFALIGYGVGAAALGTGLFLLFTGDEDPEQMARESAKPSVRPLVGWRTVGVEGRF